MASKILVTGANGQLGSELREVAKQTAQYEYTFIDQEDLDLTDESAIHSYFKNRSFEYLINCAAYTAVDLAEEQADLAFLINSTAVKIIAEICLEKRIRLIHISTDYVFDGELNQPIPVTAATNPLGVYGRSKLEGEKHVTRILDNAYVIRTSWVYSSFGKNFVKTISRLAKERESLGVVYDQIGSPTYAGDLAGAILKMVHKIDSRDVDVPGVYHYTNEGVISWYDLAYFIVQHHKLPCHINPITSLEYVTKAVRPKFTVLDKQKIKNTFGLKIPHWHIGLEKCLDILG